MQAEIQLCVISGQFLVDFACGVSIGPHTLPNRAFLAPMAGITDRPMRTLAARFGAGMVVSEMIASNALSVGNADMIRKLAKVGDLPHVVQLAGCESEWMRRGAEIAHDAGADIIDINLGCPSKRVTNGYAGSALMRVPDQALGLIETVVKATPLPVTVKMRLGWDDDSLNAPAIARRAVDAGVQMITVHGRTRQQFYKGSARWNLVRAVVEAVGVPVVVNGDILGIAEAREALEQSGAAAVMIGRGAQGRPWVVGQVGAALAGRQVPQAPSDAVAIVREHYEGMLEDYGVSVGLRAARKHLDWYLDGFGVVLSKEERRELLNLETPGAVLARIETVFGADFRNAA